jgi:hypothetical protein
MGVDDVRKCSLPDDAVESSRPPWPYNRSTFRKDAAMITTRFFRQRHFPIAILVVCGLTAGCQSFSLKDKFDLSKRIPWKNDDEPQAPGRVAAYWSEAVMNKAGEKPQRGFGGRVYFYSNKEKDPVKVEGQLVVYAFDEANRDPTDNRPSRRYVFPADQFAQHYSESEAGHSYSFWLPWDEMGGPQKEISLIARFEPLEGSLVVSNQSRHRLPGTGPPPQELAAPSTTFPVEKFTNRYANQQVGYAAETGAAPPVAGQPPAASEMTTTTITLPPRFARSLPHSAAPPAAAQTLSTTVQYGPPNPAPSQYHLRGGQTPSMRESQAASGGNFNSSVAAATPGQSPAHSGPWSHPAQATGPVPPVASHPNWPPSPAGSPFSPQPPAWGYSRGYSGFSTPGFGTNSH